MRDVSWLLILVTWCCNCNKSRIDELEQEVTLLKSQYAQEKLSTQSCRNIEVKTKEALNSCIAKESACEKRITTIEERDQQFLVFYKEKARTKIQITTAAQKEKVQKFSEMIEKLAGDPLKAARIENNIYSFIQRGKDRWINLFNYNPIDKKFLIINPAKAVYLFKSMGERMLAANDIAEKGMLDMFEFNFGDEAGELIMKMNAAELEKIQ